MANQGILSIILSSYYSGARLRNVYAAVRETMFRANIPFELVIVDDGSKDDSFQIAKTMEAEFSEVRAYQLSRNYTGHYCSFAGLSLAKGECATVIPDDEQQPYQTLVEMYRLWQQGHKVVIPCRERRDDPVLTRIFANIFYSIMNRFSDIRFPPGGADNFFIDREIIDIINSRIHPIRTTTITEVLRLGYDPYFFSFHRPLGKNNKSRWTWKKKIILAKDFFFSSSSFPIQLITNLGVFISFLSIITIFFYSYARIFGNDYFWRLREVPGWTSIIVIISFFSGLILFSLGIIAEYIWRIYEEVKQRPGYIIKKP